MTMNMNLPTPLEHHYQDLETPFGCKSRNNALYYNFVAQSGLSDLFVPTTDEPAPAPEAPAAGEPLLNDLELDSTNQFFDAFKNDTFFDDSKLMESLGAFPNEPIPNFHSVSSSYGNPVHHSLSPSPNFDFSSFGTDLSSRFGQTQLASPTAMSHMTHSSHGSIDMSEYGGLPPDPPYSPFLAGRKNDSRHSSGVFDPRVAYGMRPNMSRSSYGRHPATTARPDNLSHRDQIYPPSRHASVRHGFHGSSNGLGEHGSGLDPASGLVFGSDVDFRNQTYVAPGSNLEDIKGAEMKIQSTLKMFAQDDQTAPSSPAAKPKRRLSSNAMEEFNRFTGRKDRGSDGNHVPMNDKRQRKLRLENGEDEEDEDSGDGIPRSSGPSRTLSKRSRPKGKPRTSSDGGGSQGGSGVGVGVGRRKSVSGEQKLPRQNLTEEEKKQNHIKSEQKRRNQIKDGFSNLTEMMPDAASAGSSKCAILSQAVDWMAGLIDGNRKLRAQLDALVL